MRSVFPPEHVRRFHDLIREHLNLDDRIIIGDATWDHEREGES